MTQDIQNKSRFENNLIFIFCILTALPVLLSINLPRSFAFVPGASATIIFALWFFFAQTKPTLSKKTTALIAIILATSALSIIWAKFPETSQAKLIKLIPLLLPQILLISLATSLKANQIQSLTKLIPIIYLAATSLLIFEIFNKGFFHNILRGEDISVITNHADFNRGTVALALYAIPTFMLLTLNKTFKKQRFPIACAAVLIFGPLIIAMSLSQSQSSLMSISLGLIFLLFFPYAFKKGISALKYAIIILTLTAPFFMPPIYDHFAQDIQNIPIMAHGYAGHRLEIWDFVSRYTLENPILGYGIEATRDIKDFDSKLIFDKSNATLHPHNYVLQIWIEFGLFGALILSALTYMVFTNIQKNHAIAQQKLLLPTLMATLFTASVSYGLWQGVWMGLMFHVAAITLMTNTLLKANTNTKAISQNNP